ncbi:MAG: 1,4-dihydroxy-2-naphthoate octaprenyltransferase [Deltaproteobacteria bacterium]|nr:1,4-dihydroxy-2-naphthoate octaprenyltransferase [Deltaproteobacteria bacterium]
MTPLAHQEPGKAPSPLTLWLWAARPRTLPLAASAIMLGFGLSVMQGAARWGIFLLALVTALLLQILSNLANDYGDAVSGADTPDRLGPRRMVGSGLTSPQRMFRAVLLAAAMALVSGLGLVFAACWGNWPLLAFFMLLGASCIAAAVLYTVGKRPYGYLGLGDFMAGLFFGPVAVWGSAVLCGAWQFAPLFLPGMAAGFCSTMVLNVNNMRDIETDRRTGKMTVAARLGLANATRYHLVLALLVVLCWAGFWLLYRPGFLPALALALPLLESVRRAVSRPRDAANLNAQLRNTVIGSAVCSAGMGLLCLLP